MKITTANRICKKLSCQYGIVKPPVVIPMKYSRTGFRVILGYYNESKNEVEINRYALEDWPAKRIREVITHELVHARCYQDFKVCCGHDKRFRLICDLYGIAGDVRHATSKQAG